MSNNNNNQPPPWSEAPPWATYMAQDEDGSWYWYELKPRTYDKEQQWLEGSENGLVLCALKGNIKTPNWRDTLQKRPENE